MLGTTTAVLGGVVAGVAGNAFGQEKPKPPAAGPAATPAAGPNLTSSGGPDQGRQAPRPQGGQDLLLPRHSLRGSGTLRTAQAGAAVGGHQERAGVGPGLPESGADDGQRRRARVSASLLDRERALPVSERLDPEPHPGGEEARHGLDARRRLHERLLHGVVHLRRQHAQRVRRRRGRQHEPPAEHPRHARSVGLWPAVRELALHRHGRSRGGAAVGAATTSKRSAAIPAT